MLGAIDGIKADIQHDLGCAIHQVGKGKIDRGKCILRGSYGNIAASAQNARLFHIEDALDDRPQLFHLLGREAGNINCLLELPLEPLPIFGRVLRNQDRMGIEWNRKNLSQAKNDVRRLSIRNPVKLHAQVLALDGVVEDSADAVQREDLAKYLSCIAMEMKVGQAGAWQ